ncbi:MAG: hypothetical protein OXF79_28870 [Chloroflexi bacterium]|nr:hypothetical protein [Chloroflexota bacterium]
MTPLVIADNEQKETDRTIMKLEPFERGGKLMLTIYFENLAGGVRPPTITAPVAEEAAEALGLI